MLCDSTETNRRRLRMKDVELGTIPSIEEQRAFVQRILACHNEPGVGSDNAKRAQTLRK